MASLNAWESDSEIKIAGCYQMLLCYALLKFRPARQNGDRRGRFCDNYPCAFPLLPSVMGNKFGVLTWKFQLTH